MKNILRILIITTCIFIDTKPLLTQWVQTNSFSGGYFSSFAVSGTNIFAGANGVGVFLSANNGTNWTKLGLEKGFWTSALAVSPNGTGGINLFAGACYGKGVFLSTDNGTSWTAVNSGLTNTYINALAVSPNGTGGTNLFAGTASRESKNLNGGIFLSTNNGTSWTAVYAALTHYSVVAFAVSGTNLFAGTDGSGVFLSTNNGTSWTAVNNGFPQIGTDIYITIYAFAIIGTNLFAGTSSGVFLSTNNGINWSSVSTGLSNTPVHSLAVSGTNLFAGTDGGGVFLSTNTGTSWTQVNTGLTFPYVYAFAVASNGKGGTNLFAGTWGSGVFLSTNNGTSWAPVDSGLTCWTVGDLAVCDTNIFVGTLGCGAFVSTNYGSSWTQVNAGLTFPNVYALAVAPNSNGGMNLVAGSGGLFLSSNSGQSWIQINANNLSVMGDIHALAVSGTGTSDTKIFAGSNALDIHQVQVFLSTDEGFTWTQFGVNINASRLNALAVYDAKLFAGTDRGVFLTTDGGMNWTQKNNGLADTNIYGLMTLPNKTVGTNIFAGTNCGIFLSTDDGTSWSAADTDSVSTQASAIVVCKDYIFAGINGGVWKRPFSEILTSVKDNGSNLPIRFSLSQNYPNPFNPTTTISFALPKTSFVNLKIFDLLGREVAIIVSEEMSAGSYTKQLNAANMSSGIYFYRLQAGLFTVTKKLVLLR
jgi:hypothetical protein